LGEPDAGCVDGTETVLDLSAYPEDSADGYNSPNNPSEDKKTVTFILVGVLGAIALVGLIVFFAASGRQIRYVFHG
jgi:hypothetical protein